MVDPLTPTTRPENRGLLVTTERRKDGRRAPGRPPKHAARALARYLAAGQLDQRTWIARALKDIRDDLAGDKGGWGECSASERILISRAAALTMIVQAMETWVFAQGDVVGATGEPLAVLKKGLATHTANLARMLVALGLQRRARDVIPLDQYLAGKAATNGHAGAPPGPSVHARDAGHTDASRALSDVAEGTACSEDVHAR
jgi:hypothetical protein